MRDSRDDIKKIIEWHVTCITDGPGQFPCNFIPLIVGPSGSGKTYTVTEALNDWDVVMDGKPMTVPFVYVDATQLTAEGWEGQSLSDVLRDAFDEYGDAMEYGIIYIDEIDKLAAKSGSAQRDAHLTGVQSNLLSWLDKSSDKILPAKRGYKPLQVSTAQITWIFSGAFEQLFMAKSLDNKGMGFNALVDKNTKVDYTQKMTWQDIKKAGLMPELVNRMNILIQTYEYSDKELLDIIKEDYDKKFIETILDVKMPASKVLRNTLKHKAGARGISKALYQEALERYKLKE